MKIRKGFVTNSSSSSFVIAKKSNATKKDLLATINEEEIKRFIKDYGAYGSDWFRDEIDDWDDLVEEQHQVEAVVEIVMGELKGKDLDLGEWIVIAGECGSDEGIFSNLLYGYDIFLKGNDFIKYQLAN